MTDDSALRNYQIHVAGYRKWWREHMATGNATRSHGEQLALELEAKVHWKKLLKAAGRAGKRAAEVRAEVNRDL